MCYSKPLKGINSRRIAKVFNNKYRHNSKRIRGTGRRLQTTLNDLRKSGYRGMIKVGIGKGIWKNFRVGNIYRRIDISRAYRYREPVRYKKYKKYMFPRR